MAKKVHIVYTINSLKRTGPNEVLNDMIRSIDYDKYKVSVVSFLKASAPKEVSDLNGSKVSYINLNLGTKLDIVKKGHKSLREALVGKNVDIIHSHGILSDIASYRSKISKKFISTLHCNIFEDYSFTFGKIKGFLFAWWHIFYLRKFSRVVCCSESSFRAVKKYLHNAEAITNGKNPVTSNVSNNEVANVRKDLGIKQGDFVYIYAGNLSKRKNILTLLDNFTYSLRDNEHLIVLGKGDLHEQCAQYASKNVHLLGFKSDTAKFLEASDVYVSASNSEGFSISIIEALSRGLYLLLSDIPSHKEMFEIDKSVYIGETFNDSTFEHAKKLLNKRLGTRNMPMDFYKHYLTADKMMDRYDNVYQSVLR